MEKASFGKTSFGGVIMHGMQNFALLTRTLTDWLVPRGGYQRRLEARWLKPVKLGYKAKNPVSMASLSPEAQEEVQAFLAGIENNDDVQNVFVGLVD